MSQLSDVLFTYLGLHPTELQTTFPVSESHQTPSALSDENGQVQPSVSQWYQHDRHERFKRLARPAIRLTLAVLSIGGAFLFPSFENVMSLMGSGFAALTIIIIPIWIGAGVFGWHWYEVLVCVLSAVIGTIGVAASFWPSHV